MAACDIVGADAARAEHPAIRESDPAAGDFRAGELRDRAGPTYRRRPPTTGVAALAVAGGGVGRGDGDRDGAWRIRRVPARPAERRAEGGVGVCDRRERRDGLLGVAVAPADPAGAVSAASVR